MQRMLMPLRRFSRHDYFAAITLCHYRLMLLSFFDYYAIFA